MADPETENDIAADQEFVAGLVEAVLFLSTEPVTMNRLAKITGLSPVDLDIILQTLIDDYAEREGGLVIREVAGGFEMATHGRYGEILKELFTERKRDSLSKAAMECLSIIAYKQPVTIPEVDEVRGASSRHIVFQLLKKNLIKGHGKKEVPGHPTLYITTKDFLVRFGLNSLADLPSLAEIKDLNFESLDEE